jgi:hypothetical protein
MHAAAVLAAAKVAAEATNGTVLAFPTWTREQ